MILGLTFLSLMSAYWWKNYILNFKKLISLTLRDTLERTPKVISNQIHSVNFNRDADFDPDHDAEILCNGIRQFDWPWKFWAGLRLCSQHQSKSDQISTHQSPSLSTPHFPQESLCLWCTFLQKTYNSWPWKFSAGISILVLH